MKRPVSMRRSPVIKTIIAVFVFILGFFAHMVWIQRKEIIDIWNDIFLYYQD